MSDVGGIVVVGGRSSRMGGASKATLAWHGSTLVRRVAGIVSRGVGGPVVLVRSPGQSLPVLPAQFEVVEDLEEGRGPLAALGLGLETLADRCEIVYCSATDVPFLHPAFVRAVVAGLETGLDACVPKVRGLAQPLAAAYRTSLVPVVNGLLRQDRLRLSLVFEACLRRELDEASLLADSCLARLDPGLESVTNLNDPEGYEAAVSRPRPAVRVQQVVDPNRSRDQDRDALMCRAATLGEAAAARGVTISSWLDVELNGARVRPDAEEPLCEGDEICFFGESGPR